MDAQISFYLKDLCTEDNRVSDVEIDELQRQLECSFPTDYIEVLKEYNGGEGEVGSEGYVVFFSAKDLYEANKSWFSILLQDIPEYLLFGKDAADTGFAFHKRFHTYHAFGLMSNFDKDGVTFCGNNFIEFITAVGEGKCY